MSKKHKKKLINFNFDSKPKSEEVPTSHPKEEVTQEIVNSFEDALKHMDKIRDQYLTYVGKPGYNPYFHIVSHITPLMLRYQSGERSEELLIAMNGLKFTEPKV